MEERCKGGARNVKWSASAAELPWLRTLQQSHVDLQAAKQKEGNPSVKGAGHDKHPECLFRSLVQPMLEHNIRLERP